MDYEQTDVPGVLMPHTAGFSGFGTGPQKASLIQALAMKLGLMKPQLFPADIIPQPMPAPAQTNAPVMWPSYAVPGAGAATPPPVPDDGYGQIEELSNKRQQIVDELGEFSKKVLNSPLVGKE